MLRLARDRLAAILVLIAAQALFGAALVLRTTLLFLATLLLSATLVLRAALLLRATLWVGFARGFIAFLLREALALRAGALGPGRRRFVLRAAAGRTAHRAAARRAALTAHLMLLGTLGLHRTALWAGVLRYGK